MNMRDQFKMAFSAARLATCVDNRDFAARIPSRQLALAVNYSMTERGDRLAIHFPGRILREMRYKRDRAENPWCYESFNCRCVPVPIEVDDE